METKNPNQKHGFPAFVSFFLPGIGQLIKGHIGKCFLIWLYYAAILCLIYCLSIEGYLRGPSTGISFITVLLLLLILWIWNIYDAYNAN
jgi:hypothetical protein